MRQVTTETTTKNENGSPDPSLEAKDGETAGTESEHRKLIVCPPDAALRDCVGCRIMAACKADIRAYQAQETMEDLLDIQREDRADRVRADKENEEPIIDSDTIDAVIHLGGRAEALEPGFDARAWLGARGL